MRIFLSFGIFVLASCLFFVLFDTPHLSLDFLLLFASLMMLVGGLWCILAALLPEKENRAKSGSKRSTTRPQKKGMIASSEIESSKKVEVSFDDFGLLPTDRVHVESGLDKTFVAEEEAQEKSDKDKLNDALEELKAIKDKLANRQVIFGSDVDRSCDPNVLETTQLDQDAMQQVMKLASSCDQVSKKHPTVKVKELPTPTLLGSEPLHELHTLDSVDTLDMPVDTLPKDQLEMTQMDCSHSEDELPELPWELGATRALDCVEDVQEVLREEFRKRGLSADEFLPLEEEAFSSKKALEETMVV